MMSLVIRILIFCSMILSEGMCRSAYCQDDSNTLAQDDFSTLVKEVQVQHQSLYETFQRVTFTGYSKTYVYMDWSIFGLQLIPGFEEYHFEGVWNRPDSVRIVIRAYRKVESDNIEVDAGDRDTTAVAQSDSDQHVKLEWPHPNPFRFSYDSSVLGIEDDDEDEDRRDIMYPFSPGADSLYEYAMLGSIDLNPLQKVLAVKASPKSSDTPGVIGTFMIDPDAKVVVRSDFIINQAGELIKREMDADSGSHWARYLLGDIGEDRHVKVEKALFYSSYWLPHTVEEEFHVSILGINAKVQRILEFDYYDVNPEIPDTSDVADRAVSMQIDSSMQQELTGDLPYPNRLTAEEENRIIDRIENTLSSMAIYNDLFDTEAIATEAMNLQMEKYGGRYLHLAEKFSDNFQYNRVEGLRLSYGIGITNPGIRNSSLSLRGGYGVSDERLKGAASYLVYLGTRKKVFLDGTLFHSLGFEEDRRLTTTGRNTFTSAFFNTDYRDYYYKTGGSIGLGFIPTGNFALKVAYVDQSEKSASANTDFSFAHWQKPFRVNPGIRAGVFRGIRSRFLYRRSDVAASVSTEYTDSGHFHSDFSYTTVKADIMWKNRFNRANSMHLFLSGGASRGTLTPQRWFDFGGKSFMNYQGNLRGVGYKHFTGDRMVHGTLEYTRRGGGPMRMARQSSRIMKFANLLKFTVWTGMGWSRLSEQSRSAAFQVLTPIRVTDGVYREIGIGVGDPLNIFRVDFIANSIEDNAVLVSFNVFR